MLVQVRYLASAGGGALVFVLAACTTSRSEWTLSGTAPAGAYELEGRGRVTDSLGATLTLHSAVKDQPGFGTAMTMVGADTLRGRRVHLAGELRGTNVSRSAMLWLRVDGSSGKTLLFANTADHAVRGTTGAARQDVSLIIPPDAARLALGVLLDGEGEVSVRNLRLIVSSGTAAAPSGQARRELDSAIALARLHSLWRDTVTWRSVESDVRALAAGAQTAEDVYPAIRLLLARLGDNHSLLIPLGQASGLASGYGNRAPEVRVLLTGQGYINVPGFTGTSPDSAAAYATRMHAALRSVASRAPCGWIVDLRQDTGGNMWPMLAGLAPLLGRDTVGGFAGSSSTPSSTRRSGWVAGGVLMRDLAPLATQFVAVLTGPRTASSGEAVVVAFRGRPRTRSFGLSTAGLSTANAFFPLPDGAVLFLTTALLADRTGHLYGGRIPPDDIVPDKAGESDSTITVAAHWLMSETKCDVSKR